MSSKHLLITMIYFSENWTDKVILNTCLLLWYTFLCTKLIRYFQTLVILMLYVMMTLDVFSILLLDCRETYGQTCCMSCWQRYLMSLVYCCLTAERHMDKRAICHDDKDIGCLLYIAVCLQRDIRTKCYMSS